LVLHGGMHGAIQTGTGAMWTSMSTGMPISTTTLIAASIKGKARARVNGSMMPATGVESLTGTRELPRSTTVEHLPQRILGRPTGGKVVRVQEALQRSRPAPDREEQIVADRQAPRPWIVADSRVPSVVRTEEALPGRIAVVDRQAAKACPPNHPREAVAVPAAVEVPAAEEVPEVVAVVPAAAADEDKEERI